MIRNPALAAALVRWLREPRDGLQGLGVLASADIRHLHEDGLALVPGNNWKTGVAR